MLKFFSIALAIPFLSITLSLSAHGETWSRDQIVGLINQSIQENTQSHDDASLMIEAVRKHSLKILPNEIDSTRDDLNQLFEGYIKEASFLKEDKDIIDAAIQADLHNIVITIRGAELIKPITDRDRETVISQMNQLYDYLWGKFKEAGLPTESFWLSNYHADQKLYAKSYSESSSFSPLNYSFKRVMTDDEFLSAKNEIDQLVSREASALIVALSSDSPSKEAEWDSEFNGLYANIQRIGTARTVLSEAAEVSGEDLSPGYNAVLQQLHEYRHNKAVSEFEDRRKKRDHEKILNELEDSGISVRNPDVILDEQLADILSTESISKPIKEDSSEIHTEVTTSTSQPTTAKESSNSFTYYWLIPAATITLLTCFYLWNRRHRTV